MAGYGEDIDDGGDEPRREKDREVEKEEGESDEFKGW